MKGINEFSVEDNIFDLSSPISLYMNHNTQALNKRQAKQRLFVIQLMFYFRHFCLC